MTASEQLIATGRAALDHLAAMSLLQISLNLAITGALVAAGFAAAWGLRRLLRAAARRVPGPHTAERTIRTSRVTRILAWTLRLVTGVVVLALIANVWGLDVMAWASRGYGEAFVGGALRLVAMFIVAVAAFELAGLLIGRVIGGIVDRAHDPRRQAQLRTLGPLLQGIAQTAILIVVTLMALSEIGVKIGPLLAGAGVVGIALGFGAQTLVKDFLTGMFLIVEDIVSVGDIVRIGASGGLVESMTLRTIRLRDFDGTLHVFPYSEAQVVHNLTKTFSYYVFDLQISYGSDIDEALRIMKAVGAEMQAEPEFADKILEPIEVVGVDNLADSGVMLKARIKTLPIQQWTVGREYNRRIKLAFDRAGVEIPFPHMQVVLPEQQLSELARH